MTNDYCRHEYTGEQDAEEAEIAIVLLRQSTTDKQGDSFSSQYAVCKSYVENELGCQLSREFKLIDTHPSGGEQESIELIGAFGERKKGKTKLEYRTGLTAAKREIKRRRGSGRPVNALVFYDQSRSSRLEMLPAMNFAQELVELGVLIAFAKDRRKFDPNDPVSLIMYMLSAHSNSEQSFAASRDTMNLMGVIVENGYWPGGNPPIGYELHRPTPQQLANHHSKHTRVEKTNDDLHNRVIPQVFQMAIDGMPLKRIARWATEEGLRTHPRRTNDWQGGGITSQVLKASILQNDIYKGVMSYPKNDRPRYNPRGDRARVLGWQGPPIIIEMPQLAYVSAELFDAVNERLSASAREMGQTASRSILTGILKCPKHKTNLYHDGKRHYRCKSNRSPQCDTPPVPDDVEQQAIDAFLLLTCDEETVKELVARYRETREDLDAEINWLENEIEVVKRKQKALLERFTRGYGFSAEDLDREAQLIKGKLFKLEEELSIAKSKLDMNADEILALGQRFLQAERAEQNRILRRVFSGAVYIPRKNKLGQNISELVIRTSDLVRNLEITVARTLRFYPFQYFTDPKDAEILRQHGPVIAAGGWDGTELPDDVKRVVANIMEPQNNTLTGIAKIETKDGTGDAPQIRGILRAQTSDGKCILKHISGAVVDELQTELIKPVTGRKAKLLAELEAISKKRSSGSGSSIGKLKKVNCGDRI